MTLTVTFFLVFASAAIAHAVLSPVLGPWTKQHSVDVEVSWANESAGLVQVVVGGTASPIVVEVGGDQLFVIMRPNMPAWALPPRGGGGACVDIGAGEAYAFIDPTGELVMVLSDANGAVPLEAGMRLHWQSFSFRFVPRLRDAPSDGLLAPIDLPYSIARGDDGQVTLSLWTTPWAPTLPTRELEFTSVLPKRARPSRSITTCLAVNIPQWSAHCQLHIATCGSVTLKCAGGMQNPVMLPAGDRALTYVSSP